jgi:hypothetical protein
LKRDDFTCRYCGANGPGVKLEVDHVIPASLGGSNADHNLVSACFPCNRGKRNKRLLPTPPEPLIPNISQEDVKSVCVVLGEELPLSNDKARTLQTFFTAHGVDETIRAAMVAKGKDLLPDDRWRYFCGVNWRWIKAGITEKREVIPKRPQFNHRKSSAWSRLNPPPEK